MARFIKKHKKEIGISPDELFFTGIQKTDDVLMRIIDFDKSNLEESTISNVDEVAKYKDTSSVTWFNIDGLHHISVMEEVASVFNLDRLILADVMNTDARPKVHEYDNCIFVSLKMMKYDEETNVISVENLSLIITKAVVITFQEIKGDVFEPVRERIRKQKKRIRSSGTDYLAFALLDIVIDNYIYVISILGEKIEDIEDDLANEPKHYLINEINKYKKELNFVRKNINPAKEMILSLLKIDSELIKKSSFVHFNELKDNMNQAIESAETYREILSDQLNIYHTTISSKLNDVMKFLTIFSVIFIPITFIAGIYGTNFDVLPEIHYQYSYFIMWGVIIVIVAGMLIYFKKRKWF
jgi:magnesium transporter